MSRAQCGPSLHHVCVCVHSTNTLPQGVSFLRKAHDVKLLRKRLLFSGHLFTDDAALPVYQVKEAKNPTESVGLMGSCIRQ